MSDRGDIPSILVTFLYSERPGGKKIVALEV